MKTSFLALGVFGIGVLTYAADAKAACSSGLSCEVCDVSGYSPTEMAAPIGPTSGGCTDADISDFDTACLSSNATQPCVPAWASAARTPTC